MKYGFVYIWRDKKRKMYYIGSHWGTFEDGYICSSNRMRDAHRRRPEDFKRRILDSNIQDRKQLFEEEYKWLQKAEKKKIKYYNLHFVLKEHWHLNDQSRLSISEKISNTMKEKWKDDEYKNMMKTNHIGQKAWNKNMKFPGRVLTEETKQKISKSKKGKPNGISGRICSTETRKKIAAKTSINNIGNKYHLGCSMSESAKEKISKANKGKLQGDNNPSRRPEVREKRYATVAGLELKIRSTFRFKSLTVLCISFLSHHKRIPVIMFQCNTRSPHHTFQRVIGYMYRQFYFIAQSLIKTTKQGTTTSNV